MQRCTVVFDFDGTLALGRGPLDAYATAVGELTNPGIADDCRAAISRFDAGGSNFIDAYDAVRVTALPHGVTEKELSRAYLRSRELLATDAAPVHPPEGLREFFSDLSAHAVCVVATNAPDIGIMHALRVLGIADFVDKLYCSVGKPSGLEPIIESYITRGPTLSVGDIWENDLGPAQRFGAATALVGVSQSRNVPTMRGVTLTELYDVILDWVMAQPIPASPLDPPLSERPL